MLQKVFEIFPFFVSPLIPERMPLLGVGKNVFYDKKKYYIYIYRISLISGQCMHLILIKCEKKNPSVLLIRTLGKILLIAFSDGLQFTLNESAVVIGAMMLA